LFLRYVAEAEQREREAKAKGQEEAYQGDSKFATHLKRSAGVSSFAKNRTLKEQREYLPAFACREDLMKVMRENQGKVGRSQVCQFSHIYISRHRRWRNWIWKDDPISTIFV
jgi:hypothetical protein